MGVEEQKEEREVLDSIFPDEIQDTSETAYRISIALDLPQDAEELDEPLVILLNVSYPDAYPDVAPNLDITSPQNAQRHELLDISEDKAQLLDALNSTIEESLGMAMIFTLVATLKDAAETLMGDRARQEQEKRDVVAREKEEQENRKFHGKKVTRERFLEWRDKFKKEMEEIEKQKKEDDEAELKTKRVKMEEKKLTGRQLYERGLVGKMEIDDDVDEIVEATEKVKVEA